MTNQIAASNTRAPMIWAREKRIFELQLPAAIQSLSYPESAAKPGKSKTKNRGHFKLKSRQNARSNFVVFRQLGNTFQCLLQQTVNLNGTVFRINRPVFLYSVFCVKLSLHRKIAPPVFRSGR